MKDFYDPDELIDDGDGKLVRIDSLSDLQIEMLAADNPGDAAKLREFILWRREFILWRKRQA